MFITTKARNAIKDECRKEIAIIILEELNASLDRRVEALDKKKDIDPLREVYEMLFNIANKL